MTDDWLWLTTVDPKTVERERFKITARSLRRREGTQLGQMQVEPSPAELRRQQRAARLHQVVGQRQQLHSRIRTLENQLVRERHESERMTSWQARMLERARNGGLA